jgi:hypothetical protein
MVSDRKPLDGLASPWGCRDANQATKTPVLVAGEIWTRVLRVLSAVAASNTLSEGLRDDLSSEALGLLWDIDNEKRLTGRSVLDIQAVADALGDALHAKGVR